MPYESFTATYDKKTIEIMNKIRGFKECKPETRRLIIETEQWFYDEIAPFLALIEGTDGRKKAEIR